MKNLKKLLSFLSAAVLSCSMIACGGNTGDGHTHTFESKWTNNDTHHWHKANCGHTVAPKDCDGYAAHENKDTCICGYTKPATAMQWTEFIANHKDKAQHFVEFSVRPTVVGDKNIKAENWVIKADDSGTKLQEVTIVYTYVLTENNRQVEIAKVTFDTLPLLGDIADGKATVTADALNVSGTAVFNFNAKTNYNKSKLAGKLFEKAGLTGNLTDNYPNALFKEIEGKDENYRSFELLDQSNNRIAIKRIDVEKGKSTDADLIENLDGPFTKISTTQVCEIEGTNIYNSAYALENLGAEEEPDPTDPTNPDTPDTPSAVTNAEIIAALEQYCLEPIWTECYGTRANKYDDNKDKISNIVWYISNDTSKKIVSVECQFYYDYTWNNYSNPFFTIGKVDFATPISAKNLIDNNLGNPTYSKCYNFNYDPTIQETRADLTNAICDKLFGENENATRFIVDKGEDHNSELGELRQLTVIQLSEAGVKEISINIKNSSNDTEYISKLSNTSNYRTYDEKSYTISGVKVENNNSPFAAD